MKMNLPPSFHKEAAVARQQCFTGGRTPRFLYLPTDQYQQWQQLVAFNHRDTYKDEPTGENTYLGLLVRQNKTADIKVSELPLE